MRREEAVWGSRAKSGSVSAFVAETEWVSG